MVIVIVALMILLGATAAYYFLFYQKGDSEASALLRTATMTGNAPAGNETVSARTLDEQRLTAVEKLREALSSYGSDHDGVYPAAIETLVPQYLSDMPEAAILAAEAYQRNQDEKGYTLTYDLGSYQQDHADVNYDVPGEFRTIRLVPGAHSATPVSIAVDLRSAGTGNATNAPEVNANAASGAGVDTDSDGLSDEEETRLGTDPNKHDTDGDTVTDFQERTIYETNPLSTDSDADGYADSVEIQNGFNPNGPGAL